MKEISMNIKEWKFNTFTDINKLTIFLNERNIKQNEFQIIYKGDSSVQYLLIYLN